MSGGPGKMGWFPLLQIFQLLLILLSFTGFSCTTSASPLDKDSALIGGDQDRRDELVEPVSTAGENNGISKNASYTIGTLTIPAGYDKLVLPLGNVSPSIFVNVELGIRAVLGVDTKGETVELDTEVGVSWIDWEIWNNYMNDSAAQEKGNSGDEEIILDSEVLRSIWKPDIYIDEMASADRTSLLSKLITLKFLVGNEAIAGTISFKSRQSLTLRCDMDFHYYPADIQTCDFNIRSYSYPQDKLFLMWDNIHSIYLDQLADSNFDFQISSVEPGGDLEDFYITSQIIRYPELSTNYSALHFTLQIRRNLTYHLVQTYLPAVLLMLITWLCFLLPVDMVEARIGISMTTLLTLTAMFAGVREQAPEVSYTMAIDIWMVFCIGLVFLALVLFTVVHWMQRKLEQFQEIKGNKEQAMNVNGEPGMPNGDQTADARPLPKKEGKKHLEESDTFINFVDNARRYSFWLFALVFILFLSVYTAWILIGSQHFEWNPNPKFNAIDDPTNDTNHLFVFKSTKFAKDVVNDPYKETASENRYGDIVDDVIKPRLAQRT